MFGIAAVLVTSWSGPAPPAPRAVARAVAPRCNAVDDRYQIKLPKPLGMLLEERDEGGVSVEELVEGGSAFESAIMPGDVLIAVGVDDVSTLPFEAVMGAIGEAPAELVLTFDRPAAPATAPPAAAPPAAVSPPAPPSGPVVVSTDSGERITVRAGTALLRKALLDAKVDLYTFKGKLTNCGGAGQCKQCMVEVIGGADDALSPRTPAEAQFLKKRPDSYRMSCQAVVNGDVRVRVQPK